MGGMVGQVPKLTVTTSARSLGKTFFLLVPTNLNPQGSRGPARIFNRITILETLLPSFSRNEDATAVSLFRFSSAIFLTKPSRSFLPSDSSCE